MAQLDDDAMTPKITSSQELATTVITIAGEIDLGSADAVRAELRNLLSGEQSRVVFDLSALEFMDSSGISLLLAVAERVPTVEIRNPTPIVRQLIEMTGLSDTLHLVP